MAQALPVVGTLVGCRCLRHTRDAALEAAMVKAQPGRLTAAARTAAAERRQARAGAPEAALQGKAKEMATAEMGSRSRRTPLRAVEVAEPKVRKGSATATPAAGSRWQEAGRRKAGGAGPAV